MNADSNVKEGLVNRGAQKCYCLWHQDLGGRSRLLASSFLELLPKDGARVAEQSVKPRSLAAMIPVTIATLTCMSSFKSTGFSFIAFARRCRSCIPVQRRCELGKRGSGLRPHRPPDCTFAQKWPC
mmetsp:Transcript_53641/g.138190  ORF Transcript_53641/g.138190 Transcript_53641/m.138190 type:complete len:126 (+) Transcript_53641:664-1041(+)